ncbi:MAG: hypothetical protein U1E65_11505 [Myxococcota bacterium]
MLTRAAHALAQQYELDQGTLPTQVQQELAKSAEAGGKALSLQDMQQMLLACVPDRADQINKYCQQASKIDCPHDVVPGLNILEARVKTRDVHTQSAPEPRRYDPYDVVFEVPAKTAFVVFFNARNVDAAGHPAIMGLSTREGNDPKILSKDELFIPAGTQIQSQPFGKNASIVKFHEDNSAEFQKGDPIIGIALDAQGKFISAETKTRPLNEQINDWYPPKVVDGKYIPDESKPLIGHQVQTGEQLDTTGVVRFDDKLAMEVKAKAGYSPANWMQEPLAAGDITATFMAKRGFIFEPGAQAELTYGNKKMTVTVEGRDAEVMSVPVRLPGSKSQVMDVSPSNSQVGSIYGQYVMIQTRSDPKAADAQQASIQFTKMVMPYLNTGTATIGSKPITLGDVILDPSNTAGALLDIKRRPGPNAASGSKTQLLDLRLDNGFLNLGDRDLKGFQVEVGLSAPDPSGKVKWAPFDRKKLEAGSSSKGMGFMVPLENAADFEKAGGKLEIRVYDPNGLPVTRLLAPVNQHLAWAADIFG